MTKKNFYFLVFYALMFSFALQMIGITNPILDIHGFRQTQTAISVYYMLKDGYSIFYQTPVFGYPWKLPFEAPVYQTIVFLLVKIFQAPLDLVGRTVSLGFYYGSVFVLYFILKELKFDLKAIFIIMLTIIFSPIYLFWSRTFLIESTALFFCLGSILFSLKYYSSSNKIHLLWGLLFATIACLAKITSFLPSAVFLVVVLTHKYRTKVFNHKTLLLAVILIIGALPAIIYTRYADFYKLQNLYSSFLTSKALKNWNFGTIEQRMEPSRVLQILHFTISNLGYLVIPCVISYIVSIKQRTVLQFAALIAYLSSIIVFFNLYYIHNYYYYSNAIFGLIFMGMEINTWLDNKILGTRFNFTIGSFLVIAIGLLSYKHFYYNAQSYKFYNNSQAIKRATIINNYTDEDQFSIICGADWNSEIPYYSRRKAIMLTGWDGLLLQNIYATIEKSGGMKKVGAIGLINLDQHPKCSQLKKVFSNNTHILKLDSDEFIVSNNFKK